MEFDFSQNVYSVAPLAKLGWLEHGFGNRFFEPPAALTTLRQIHSDATVYAARDGCLGEGDALLSDTPGRVIAVKTADCLPILLVDESHRTVAAVHAGWRGTAARISQKTVEAMSARWGTSLQDLHVAIGPGIGPCCFEVGPEVAVQLGAPAERAKMDLEGINRSQLLAMGIDPARIYTAGLCTCCRADDFYSFRRDREAAGRMYSFIGIKTQRARV